MNDEYIEPSVHKHNRPRCQPYDKFTGTVLFVKGITFLKHKHIFMFTLLKNRFPKQQAAQI